MKILTCLAIFLFNVNAFCQSFAIIGDAGVNNKFQEMTRLSILNSNVENLILPGDNIYDLSKTYEEVWGNWLNNEFNFYVAIGNHTHSYTEEIEFFNMPGEYYTFKKGSGTFIVLNSDNQNNVPEQLRYLEKSINAHETGHLFVIVHHPPVTLSQRHGWTERREFLSGVKKILFKYQPKISGVISGHDHLATLATMNSIPVIVSGAVFESRPFRPVSYRNSEGILVQTEWINEDGFYWVRLDLVDDGGYWLNFVRVDKDEVSCSIYVNKGKVFPKPNCL